MVIIFGGDSKRVQDMLSSIFENDNNPDFEDCFDENLNAEEIIDDNFSVYEDSVDDWDNFEEAMAEEEEIGIGEIFIIAAKNDDKTKRILCRLLHLYPNSLYQMEAMNKKLYMALMRLIARYSTKENQCELKQKVCQKVANELGLPSFSCAICRCAKSENAISLSQFEELKKSDRLKLCLRFLIYKNTDDCRIYKRYLESLTNEYGNNKV